MSLRHVVKPKLTWAMRYNRNRREIMEHIVQGESVAEISRKTGHCRQLIGDIRKSYSNGDPIENMWAIVKNGVEDAQPETIEDLKNTAFNVWESVEQVTIDNLINSMVNRLNQCVAKRGDKTGY
jgi:transposase-like protein